MRNENELSKQYSDFLKKNGYLIKREFFNVDILASKKVGNVTEYRVIEVKISRTDISRAMGQVLFYCLTLKPYFDRLEQPYLCKPVIAALGELTVLQNEFLSLYNVEYFNLDNIYTKRCLLPI